MNIAVICAMSDELDAVLSRLITYESMIESHLGNDTHIITYQNHSLYLCLSGIGKVNSAIMTQKLIDTYQIDFVLNIGVAGSLIDEINFGDIVIADDLVQHDVDVTAFGLARGQIPRLNTFSFKSDVAIISKLSQNWSSTAKLHIGRILSGDQFIHSGEVAINLAQEFQAKACEMEGAAIAHTCYLNNIPFVVIRSISDKAGKSSEENAEDSYKRLLNMAAANAANVFEYVIGVIA